MSLVPRAVLVLAVAFACFLPQAAQASPTFIAGEYPAGVETASAGTYDFVTDNGVDVECHTVFLGATGTLPGSRSTLKAIPFYSSCTVFEGVLAAEVLVHECGYSFLVELKAGEDWKGKTTIACPEGKSIEVKIPAAGCVIEVGPQSLAAQSVTYKNAGASAIEVSAAAASVSYTSNGHCLDEAGAATGKYSGQAKLNGTNAKAATTSLQVGEGPVFWVKESATVETTEAGAAEFETEEELLVKCAGADFESSTPFTESTSISVDPSYSSCTISKLPIVMVTTNGCQERYEVTTATTGSKDWDGFMAIDCPAGKALKISIPSVGCEVDIGPQSSAKDSITYQTVGEGEMRATASSLALAYTQNGSCPGGASNGQATYDEVATLSGLNGAEATTGIFLKEPGQVAHEEETEEEETHEEQTHEEETNPPPELHADAYPSGIETLTSSEQTFTSEGKNGTPVPFACPGIDFTAPDNSINGPSTTVTVDVEYEDEKLGEPCLSASVFEIEVEENGCQLEFHSLATLNSDNGAGDIDIVNCEGPGIEILIEAIGCEIIIPEQTVQGTAGEHPIRYEDETNGSLFVTTTPEKAKVTYEDNENCLEDAGHHFGTYEGSETITGTNELGQTTSIGLE